jgi:hypothetical protein
MKFELNKTGGRNGAILVTQPQTRSGSYRYVGEYEIESRKVVKAMRNEREEARQLKSSMSSSEKQKILAFIHDVGHVT